MKQLAIAIMVCGGCAAPRVNGFFEHEIGSVKDPGIRADLRSIEGAKACSSCDRADDLRSQGSKYEDFKSYLSPPGRLAACIVTVASLHAPTRDELSLHLHTYEPFKSDPQDVAAKLCGICMPEGEIPAELISLQDKYLARCSAQAGDVITQTLEAELQFDVAAARSARDDDHVSFGEKLNYVELKLARIEEVGRDPGFVARARADVAELRYGVYGPTAMRSAFEHQAAVALARKEMDWIHGELKGTPETDGERARQRSLVHRSEQLGASIATEEAKYSFAAADVRVKTYESAPETMRVKDRLSVLKSELMHAAESNDITRTDAIAAEQKELEGQLVTLRTRFGISWSIY